MSDEMETKDEGPKTQAGSGLDSIEAEGGFVRRDQAGMITTMLHIPEFLSSWFYRNCKRQRRHGAKICGECPFREGIEQLEANNE